MATINPARPSNRQVIDLTSDFAESSTDSETTADTSNESDSSSSLAPRQPIQNPQPLDFGDLNGFMHDDFNQGLEGLAAEHPIQEPDGGFRRDPETPLVIDDFSYLDEDAVPEPQQQSGAQFDQQDSEDGEVAKFGQVLTLDKCLQRVLELFPDVNHDHVREIYAELADGRDANLLRGSVSLVDVVEKLLSNPSYPKQAKTSIPRKRKREDSVEKDDQKRWGAEDRQTPPHFMVASMRSMLKADFSEFSISEVNQTLAREKYFYKAYLCLAYLRDTATYHRRGRPSTTFGRATAETIAANSGSLDLLEELKAARTRVLDSQLLRALEATRKKAEAHNLQAAIDAGETAECQACFDDLPMNRQIHCSGADVHFTCYDCATTYIKSEVGESRCRVLCTAGCGSNFAHDQLSQLSDKKLLEKLGQLQQEKDIRDAGLEGLEECPFCDYKAIMPPVEEDFEFRCANPECEQVSCRRCKAISHIPISCEQYAKDNKLNSRHVIEEAMTAALVRSCNKCKKQFIKEYGCNKMSCSSCGNLQCYVCSKSVSNYDHFDRRDGRGGKAGARCPLYDNSEERHEREVKAAEEAARAEVVANNPDVAPEDLEIKVSDAVEQATQQRIQRNGPIGIGGGFGAEFVIGGLHRPDAQAGADEAIVEAVEQVRQRARRYLRAAHYRDPRPPRPRPDQLQANFEMVRRGAEVMRREERPEGAAPVMDRYGPNRRQHQRARLAAYNPYALPEEGQGDQAANGDLGNYGTFGYNAYQAPPLGGLDGAVEAGGRAPMARRPHGRALAEQIRNARQAQNAEIGANGAPAHQAGVRAAANNAASGQKNAPQRPDHEAVAKQLLAANDNDVVQRQRATMTNYAAYGYGRPQYTADEHFRPNFLGQAYANRYEVPHMMGGQAVDNYRRLPVEQSNHFFPTRPDYNSLTINPAQIQNQNPFPTPPHHNFDLNFRDPFNNIPAFGPRGEEPMAHTPDVRQTRQGFEHLELMRRQHDERMGLGVRPLQQGGMKGDWRDMWGK